MCRLPDSGGDYAVNLAVSSPQCPIISSHTQRLIPRVLPQAYANISLGTPFQVAGAPLTVLSHYLLDGQRWMVQTGYHSNNMTRYDVSVKGREITRAPDGNLVFPVIYASIIPNLATLDRNRSAEYTAWGRELRAEKPHR
eukprot:SAG31_NODE_6479_length_2002_cov_2.075145_2_plen_139_part_01